MSRSILPGLALAAACALTPKTYAGPPYTTDDPEPVEYLHWEIYLGSQQELSAQTFSTTSPHLEANFGPLPNVQLTAMASLTYVRESSGVAAFGPGDTELGVKWRFIQEGPWMPMVAVFPRFELPTGKASTGLGTGTFRAFVPLWLQKSFGPWSTYGGGGYWFNPGPGNQNYGYLGWQAQWRATQQATVGAEVFYTTADRVGGEGSLSFNLGLALNFTEHHHLVASGGRGLIGGAPFQGYLAYELTL